MAPPEELARLRARMIEHLEAALALADHTGDGPTGYWIESALDEIRSETLPGNLPVPPPRRR